MPFGSRRRAYLREHTARIPGRWARGKGRAAPNPPLLSGSLFVALYLGGGSDSALGGVCRDHYLRVERFIGVYKLPILSRSDSSVG
jgi:hypothetical protein